MGRIRNTLTMLAAVLMAALPSTLRVCIYRWCYGYTIGRNVQIGFGTVLLRVRRCTLGDGVRIRSFNLFVDCAELRIGDQAYIGFFNIFRGGERIEIGPYATILRTNVINSIVDRDVVGNPTPIFTLGAGATVTTGHWLDFTDRITIGAHAIVGGRNSSLWTHNRQRSRGITVGPHCYLGSEIRIAPGVELGPCCIVALGSVLLGRGDTNACQLWAGNPATVLRELTDHDLFLVTRKTRRDIPDELVRATLPLEVQRRLSADEVAVVPVEHQLDDASRSAEVSG
ncbi:MAG TPA: hypothetical protein VG713_09170 [Pirellulales bacterium]|nr:hypothetical protein [Pirellulales bacterium]